MVHLTEALPVLLSNRPLRWLPAALLLLSLTLPPAPAQASTAWVVVGETLLELSSSSSAKLEQWNTRLEEILSSSDLSRPLSVTVVPVLAVGTVPTTPAAPAGALAPDAAGAPAAAPAAEVLRATIQVNGQTLLEVTPEEVRTQGAGSVLELANRWADSLRRGLNQPETRRRLASVAGLPRQLSYQQQDYVRGDGATPDRSLFRTDGSRASGRVVFWEVVPEQAYRYSGILADAIRALQGRPTTVAKPSTGTPATIYVLNRRREFIPYTRPSPSSP